jgi:signal transduction histidine kinase
MGLPTVKKLVERQGGRVALDSSAAGRTVFRIELPLASAPGGGGSDRTVGRGAVG